jgi:hypothetical protein
LIRYFEGSKKIDNLLGKKRKKYIWILLIKIYFKILFLIALLFQFIRK